jgi:hypothetical protein
MSYICVHDIQSLLGTAGAPAGTPVVLYTLPPVARRHGQTTLSVFGVKCFSVAARAAARETILFEFYVLLCVCANTCVWSRARCRAGVVPREALENLTFKSPPHKECGVGTG